MRLECVIIIMATDTSPTINKYDYLVFKWKNRNIIWFPYITIHLFKLWQNHRIAGSDMIADDISNHARFTEHAESNLSPHYLTFELLIKCQILPFLPRYGRSIWRNLVKYRGREEEQKIYRMWKKTSWKMSFEMSWLFAHSTCIRSLENYCKDWFAAFPVLTDYSRSLPLHFARNWYESLRIKTT